MFELYRPPIVVEPLKSPVGVVIWMHGLGASGEDFKNFSEYVGQLQHIPTRFILPHARVRPVTVNQGFSMPAWYDIKSADLARYHDAEGILESVTYIHALIDQVHEAGIPTQKIILAGFSQGGVISLSAALSYPKPLAGCLVLSSYFAETPVITQTFQIRNHTLPILWMHGYDDPLIAYSYAEGSIKRLRALGYTVELKGYPVEHTVAPAAIGEIAAWLDHRLC